MMQRQERHPETRRTAQTEDRAGPDELAEVVPKPATESPHDPARMLIRHDVQYPLTDEELMDKFFRTGDESYFAIVVKRVTPWLTARVKRILKGSADCADIVQLTIIKLYEGHGYDPQRPLKKWLSVLLYNSAIDAIRKHKTVSGVDLEALIDTTESRDPQLISELRRAIQKLPEEERSVIEQNLEGLSLKEIAANQKCAISTVHRRGKAAKEHLQELLLGQYGGPGWPS